MNTTGMNDKAQEPFEIMVWISTTNDFMSWSDERKINRYQRVLQWHDYIANLHEMGKVPYVWGSHQLLSRFKFAPTMGLHIVVFRVESWREFDEIMLLDPLRDVSQYVTTPLSSLFEDRESDLQRYEKHKESLLKGRDEASLRIYSDYRALYDQTPDYVGKYPYKKPANTETSLTKVETPGDPLQILIMGMNPEEYISMWDDTRKLIHHEKVMWWHDYMVMLINQDKISHAWGTHDFCFILGSSSNSAAAVAIYKTDSYEEFDDLYRLDPIRTSSLFWSVLLQPIADQRRQDEERLKIALGISQKQMSALDPKLGSTQQ
jgi:hypothetical protein